MDKELQNIKIGLLTALDPTDKTSWSGIYYKIYETLQQQGFDVVILGPYPQNRFANRLIRVAEIFHSLFSKKRYYHHGNTINAFFRARYFNKKIKASGCHAIVGITASIEIAFLRVSLPVFYFSDTSFAQISTYYQSLSGFSGFSAKEADYIEKRAFQKCTGIIFPSAWAKKFVVEHYGIPSEKISVLKMGSNIDFPENLIQNKTLVPPIRFLFLGVDWLRKGGDIVIDTLRILKNWGVDVHLTICGCVPDIQDDFVEIIPFLNKNNPDDYKKLITLLQTSHFLFLPTRAECYGIVFAEASAYGLPSISTNTGGVSAVVSDNENGFLLQPDTSPLAYAELIMHIIKNPDIYPELCKRTRTYFDTQLDWRIFGASLSKLIIENVK